MPVRLPRQDAQHLLERSSRKSPGNARDLRRTFKPVNANNIYPESLRRLE
jgi:hypothetical protein